VDEAGSAKPKEQVKVPSMEKGDEPLSQHHEEAENELTKSISLTQGLTLLQKLGLVAVVVAFCAWFYRQSSNRGSAGRQGGYD